MTTLRKRTNGRRNGVSYRELVEKLEEMRQASEVAMKAIVASQNAALAQMETHHQENMAAFRAWVLELKNDADETHGRMNANLEKTNGRVDTLNIEVNGEKDFPGLRGDVRDLKRDISTRMLVAHSLQAVYTTTVTAGMALWMWATGQRP